MTELKTQKELDNLYGVEKVIYNFIKKEVNQNIKTERYHWEGDKEMDGKEYEFLSNGISTYVKYNFNFKKTKMVCTVIGTYRDIQYGKSVEFKF